MKFGTYKRVVKGVAVVQAVIGPGILVAGVLTGSSKMKMIGGVWCAAVTLDTARTSCMAINMAQVLSGIEDDQPIF